VATSSKFRRTVASPDYPRAASEDLFECFVHMALECYLPELLSEDLFVGEDDLPDEVLDSIERFACEVVSWFWLHNSNDGH